VAARAAWRGLPRSNGGARWGRTGPGGTGSASRGARGRRRRRRAANAAATATAPTPPAAPTPHPVAPADADPLRGAAARVLRRAALGGIAAAAAIALGGAAAAALLPLPLPGPLLYAAAEAAFLWAYARRYAALSRGSPAVRRALPVDYDPIQFYDKAVEHLKQARARREPLDEGSPRRAARTAPLVAYHALTPPQLPPDAYVTTHAQHPPPAQPPHPPQTHPV
jgi:hypothetical protein